MTTETEVTQLLRLVRNGDAEAFAEISRLYAGMVFSTCLRITGDRERASDATQNTFYQLVKNAGTVTGSLGAWLHRVATRRAVDLVRSDAARRRREAVFATSAPQETDQWADVSPLVDEAMDDLDPESRALLVAHFLEGQTTVQLAADRGVSQPTISRRIDRALAELRDRLRHKGILVALSVLATFLSETAEAAPVTLLGELGKMSLTVPDSGYRVAGNGSEASLPGGCVTKGVALLSRAGWRVAMTAGVTVLVGVGGLLTYKYSQTRVPRLAQAQTRFAAGSTATQPAPTKKAEPLQQPMAPPTLAAATPVTATPRGAPSAAPGTRPEVYGDRVPRRMPQRVAQPTNQSSRPFAEAVPAGNRAGTGVAPAASGFGGGATRRTPTVNPPPPEKAIDRFASALASGELDRILRSFVPGTAESERFRQLWLNPQSDAERHLKRALQSLGTPVKVVEATPLADGLQVTWQATVTKPLIITTNGISITWHPGEKFELKTQLKQVNGQWKIASF